MAREQPDDGEQPNTPEPYHYGDSGLPGSLSNRDAERMQGFDVHTPGKSREQHDRELLEAEQRRQQQQTDSTSSLLDRIRNALSI